MRCLVGMLALALVCVGQEHLEAQNAKNPDLVGTFMNLRGKVLLQDDLQTPGKDWKAGKGKWEVVDGGLRGVEIKSDMHAATYRRPLDFHNAVIQYQFKIDDGSSTTFSINGAKGHICRVAIDGKGFTVRKDLAKKLPGDKAALLDRLDTPIAPGQWHTMLIEIYGKEMLACLDGKVVALGSHEGIDVPLTNIGFTLKGSAVFKNLQVWEGLPNPDWALSRSKFEAQRKARSVK